MRGLKREQGITLITLALLLLMIAFFTMLVLKIGPIYINHSKVVNAMGALEQTTDIETKSKHEVSSLLGKRFNLNYVEHVDNEDIKITKSYDYLKVVIEYEVIESLMGNLSVLVEFHESFEVGNS